MSATPSRTIKATRAHSERDSACTHAQWKFRKSNFIFIRCHRFLMENTRNAQKKNAR
jgi:hypothetical protein